MSAENAFSSLFGNIEAEVTRLRAERTALEIQVNNLRNHKAEAETWLSKNWAKYCSAKAEFADIKRKIAKAFPDEAAS